MKRIVISFLLCLSAIAQADMDSPWSLYSSLSASKQTFRNGLTTNVQALGLSPSYKVQNWTLSATMSVVRYKGEELYSSKVKVPALCRLQSGETKAQRKVRLTQTGMLTTCLQYAKSIAQISEVQIAEGLQDSTLSAQRSFAFDDSSWWASSSVNISLPTGNQSEGLGTGESSISWDNTLGYDVEHCSLSTNIGYSTAFSGKKSNKQGSFLYGSVDLSYFFDSGVVVGATGAFQQSAYKGESDSRSLTLYGSYALSKLWKVMLYSTHYTPTSLSIDKEVGLQLSYSM